MPDANVAAKWYLDDEDDLMPARELARQNDLGLLQLVAPDCFYYELGNIVRTAERRGRITATRGDEIVRLIDGVPVSTSPSRLLLPIALRRSRELEINVYDAFYLATAEMLGATFVTADEPLIERLAGLPNARRL